MDLDALQAIAARTGGAYFYASDQAALEGVYAEIDRLTPRITQSTSYRPTESLAHLPLGLALLVLIGTVAWLHLRQRQRIAA